MKLWTGVLKCGTCKAVINKAEHVPDARKGWVAMTAVLSGTCPDDRTHSTGSDFNLNYDLDWTEESDDRAAT